MYRINLRSIQRFKVILPFHHDPIVLCSKDISRNNNKFCCCHISARKVTTSSGSHFFKEFFNNGKIKLQNAVRKVGVLDFSKNRLTRNGYFIYEEVADRFDYEYFFKKFNLPDTFNSWFLVMELHIWMVCVRLMAEAEEGRFVRNVVIEAMWEDVRQKSGLLGSENITTARAQIKILNEEFQAALLGYDEGLLGDDVVLAAVVWRRFFSRECNDPELVELLVKYIRKQIKHFDLLTKEDVLLSRKFPWFPLEDKT